MCHLPGLKVVAPSSPRDARGMLKSAIRDDEPVVFVEHKLLYAETGPVPEAGEPVPLGRARVIPSGRGAAADLTIVAHSYMTRMALEAARALAKVGTAAEVVDLRSLKPVDWETIVSSARRTQRVLVAEEGHRFCGLGAELAAEIQERAFGYLDAPVVRVAARDVPIPTGPEMERAVLPSGQDVIDAAERLLSGGS